jgi:class 3 adenylate cyclase
MVSTIADILSISSPTETDLLVIVFDLTNFTKFARAAPSSEVFLKMKEFNEITSKFIAKSGGLVIKYLGDAGLCVFPMCLSNQAISAMTDMKAQVDGWLKKNISGSHLAVNCHVGAVTVGPTPGFSGKPQIDVMGEAVNICFTMSHRGFVISPQAFRSLSTETRKQFRKFTPPIIYHLATGGAEA